MGRAAYAALIAVLTSAADNSETSAMSLPVAGSLTAKVSPEEAGVHLLFIKACVLRREGSLS